MFTCDKCGESKAVVFMGHDGNCRECYKDEDVDKYQDTGDETGCVQEEDFILKRGESVTVLRSKEHFFSLVRDPFIKK